MFPVSTQRRFWTYADEHELHKLRDEANKSYISRFKHKLQNLSEEERKNYFLLAAEERVLLLHYQLQLREFCQNFVPQMPKVVCATALHYLKRFYINNSVMDFSPKDIMVTCVYLSCKIEEFNVSIEQFVNNISEDQVRATKVIINNELLLMEKLNYQLLIHNPFRPVEGFMLDLKARSNLRSPERLSPSIDEFIDKLFLTDACLLYSPAQLALAAVLHAASKHQENLDAYVTDTLLGPDSGRYLQELIGAIRKIRTYLVKPIEPPPKDVIEHIQGRLEICRNEQNNPDSEYYKDRTEEDLIAEEMEENGDIKRIKM